MALPQKATAMLLDCLLSAAQDEWAAVSEPARAWLAAGSCVGATSSAGGGRDTDHGPRDAQLPDLHASQCPSWCCCASHMRMSFSNSSVMAMACCTNSTSIHADARRLPWLTLEAAIVSLIDGLPAAAQAGDGALVLHARRLTTALQARSTHEVVLSDAIREHQYDVHYKEHCHVTNLCGRC